MTTTPPEDAPASEPTAPGPSAAEPVAPVAPPPPPPAPSAAPPPPPAPTAAPPPAPSAPTPPPVAPAPPTSYPLQPGAGPSSGGALSESDGKLFGILSHIGGAFFTFLVPLILFLIYRDKDQFVRGHASQALNFNLTIFAGYMIALLTIPIGIGFILWPAVGIYSVVFAIMATIAASQGRSYKYPININLFK